MGHGFTLLNKIRCADLSFRHRVAVEYFSIKPAIRSLGDAHGHLKLFNRVNTDLLDWKKKTQSAVICEKQCPIFLWLNFLRYECSGKGLEADGMRMEVGFPGGAGEPERIYFLKSFFLPKPARPTRPEPRSSMVAGSGTG
jgi:hypothetical protein